MKAFVLACLTMTFSLVLGAMTPDSVITGCPDGFREVYFEDFEDDSLSNYLGTATASWDHAETYIAQGSDGRFMFGGMTKKEKAREARRREITKRASTTQVGLSRTFRCVILF